MACRLAKNIFMSVDIHEKENSIMKIMPINNNNYSNNTSFGYIEIDPELLSKVDKTERDLIIDIICTKIGSSINGYISKSDKSGVDYHVGFFYDNRLREFSSDQYVKTSLYEFVVRVYNCCKQLEEASFNASQQISTRQPKRKKEQGPFYIRLLYNLSDWFDRRFPDDTHYMDGL